MNFTNQFQVVFLLFFSCFGIHCTPQEKKAIESADRPNILYIMADDHTSQTFGVYETMLDGFTQTHHIQRIAREGMRMNKIFCTNSICVPSRAAILTGTYSHVNQVYNLEDALDPKRDNVAKHFQEGGYETAIVGKWHLKKEPSGFDYYNVLPGQGLYHNPKLKEKGQPWKDGWGGGVEHQGYCTDVITTETLDWLDQRNEEKPFFLMCHYKATHEPWYFDERYADLYKDVEIPLPASFWEDLSHRSEGTRERGMFIRDLLGRYVNKPNNYPPPHLDITGLNEKEQLVAAYQKFIKDYLRCVAGINDNIGRILDYLDSSGLAENTVVIYTSDQGYFLGEHGYMDKRWMFEESARMPFVIRYPKLIQPGSVNNDLILNVDFAPTFLEMAGLSIPKNMQGKSFFSQLSGVTSKDWRKDFYYRYWMHERRTAHYGIRTERYKLIFYYAHRLGLNGKNDFSTPGWELYDLKKDPFELQNVYEHPDYQALIPDLKKRLTELKHELGDSDEAFPEMENIHREYWQ